MKGISKHRPSSIVRIASLAMSVALASFFACSSPAGSDKPSNQDPHGPHDPHGPTDPTDPNPPLRPAIFVEPFEFTLTLDTQQTVTLKAKPSPASIVYKWSSSDPKIATVDEGGVVRPVSAGYCMILATDVKDPKVQGSCMISVTSVDKLLDEARATLKPGLQAGDGEESVTGDLVLPKRDEAKGIDIAWKSSDPRYVDADGKVRRPEAGSEPSKVKLTATLSRDKKTRMKSFSLTVLAKSAEPPVVVPVESVSVDPSPIVLVREEPRFVKLSAVVLPADATDKKVVWHSRDTSVADIDDDGTLRPKGFGTTTVYANSGMKNSNAVSVKVRSLALEVGEAQAALKIGYAAGDSESSVTKDLVLPTSVEGCTIAWTSNMPGVIATNGTVVRPRGTDLMPVLTARIEKRTEGGGLMRVDQVFKLRVLSAGPVLATRISLSAPTSEMTLESGEALRICSTAEPYGCSPSLAWTSSNASVASVGPDGTVTARAPGSAVITATAQDEGRANAAFTVTVRSTAADAAADAADAVDSIVYASGDSAASVTSNLGLPRTGRRGSKIAWSSSNPSAISATGQILSEGNATLTATATAGSGGSARSSDQKVSIEVKKPAAAPVPISGISLSESSLRINRDKDVHVALRATVQPSNAGAAYSWFSSDSGVVVVDQRGNVRHRGRNGKAQVGVRYFDAGGAERTAWCDVSVESDIEDLIDDYAALGIGYASGDSAESVTKPLTLTASAPKGSPVEWKGAGLIDAAGQFPYGRPSSNDCTITLSATIRSKYDRNLSRTKQFKVVLKADDTLVESVKLDQTTLRLNWNEGAKLAAAVMPATAADKSVIWSSSAPDAVSVDQDGNVRALLADRAATVTATSRADGSRKATCAVGVRTTKPDVDEDASKALASVVLAEGDTWACVRSNLTLPTAGAKGSTIRWSSTDSGLVSETGIVSRPAGSQVHKVGLSATASKGGISASTDSLDLYVAGRDWKAPEDIPGFSIYCALEGGAEDGKILFDGSSRNPPEIRIPLGSRAAVRFRIAFCDWSDGDISELTWTVDGEEVAEAKGYATMLLVGSVPGKKTVVLTARNRATGYDQKFVPVTVVFE